MPVNILSNYSHCVGTTTGGSSFDAPGYDRTVIPAMLTMEAAPSWFTFNTGVGPLTSWTYTIGVNAPLGVYSLVVVDAANIFYGTIEISITTTCFVVYNPCWAPYDRLLNILWRLPSESGWRNFIFAGKKGYGVEVGSANTFEDENGVSKFISIEDVHDQVDAASGNIPKEFADYLKTLRYSIQAYVWIPLDGVYKEILIDKGSFKLYKDDDIFYSYDFSFIYGAKLLVQHQ